MRASQATPCKRAHKVPLDRFPSRRPPTALHPPAEPNPGALRELPGAALISAVIFGVLLSACDTAGVLAPLGRAPNRGQVAVPPQGLHRVVRGDSLYSIAWRYGLDYRDLSRWNAIAEPYTIYPKQMLRISPPNTLPPMPASASVDVRSRTPKAATSRAKKSAAAASKKAGCQRQGCNGAQAAEESATCSR